MTIATFLQPSPLRLMGLCAVLMLGAACARAPEEPSGALNPELVSRAISTATDLRATGARVWCVPFARNASGIEIRGNADTWWPQAKGLYHRGKTPLVGAVMAFSGTGKLPMGHIAVVSEVVSDREIRIHHANWHRNQVSLSMPVKDVSAANDWSEVRVMTNPGAYGSVYRIDGFISDPRTPI
ncbi:CHAP domain-containing protein [Psychromarinibacter sp. C21-152]|uniref:CHAP domain-containing protein n=1 Tax=Psychromarinibacter sediminicola TaxID=3033385 RepID=A0AAE3NSC9_9RHOB|nr:CHAP domain-containing protein [Psychromarinibacter sediminicola]MDF0601579.1 CHAP domain-containing protein [Psychromarinibacter sediminicola]